MFLVADCWLLAVVVCMPSFNINNIFTYSVNFKQIFIFPDAEYERKCRYALCLKQIAKTNRQCYLLKSVENRFNLILILTEIGILSIYPPLTIAPDGNVGKF